MKLSTRILINCSVMGKGGVEPPRLAATDPKSVLSASSSTSPSNPGGAEKWQQDPKSCCEFFSPLPQYLAPLCHQSPNGPLTFSYESTTDNPETPSLYRLTTALSGPFYDKARLVLSRLVAAGAVNEPLPRMAHLCLSKYEVEMVR